MLDALNALRPPGEPTRRLTAGIFPGAGTVHLHHAIDSGYFQHAGLEVNLVQVVSSDQQMAGWNDDEYDIMHTSPDHLLRGLLKRDPVAVRAEGMGELAVHRRSGAPAPTDRWAVDNARSAFAFVLRAVLADVAGSPVTDDQLVPVGGHLAEVPGPADGGGGRDHTPPAVRRPRRRAGIPTRWRPPPGRTRPHHQRGGHPS
ncbi:hypothetical protein [Streptomyces coeruleorubidus]